MGGQPKTKGNAKMDEDEDEEEEGTKRLDAIASLFTEQAVVASLKTGKEMLTGRAAIRSSFANTVRDTPHTQKNPHPLIEIDSPFIYFEVRCKVRTTRPYQYILFAHPNDTISISDAKRGQVLLSSGHRQLCCCYY